MSVSPQPASAWLSIVGLGADGVDGLSTKARATLARAQLVFGSERQLQLVRALLTGEARVWPSPFAEGLATLLARRGQATCVLASGDPFFFGVGATLAPHLSRSEFECHPAPSSMSLAAARLGWALQDVDIVSLHGRALHAIVRFLQAKRRIFALSWDRDTPKQLAELLVARGFGPSRMHVLEELAGPHERVRSGLACELDLADVADLNLVALELEASCDAHPITLRASLSDETFVNDGQLTKQDVRAITLSALMPEPHALLWDVGAGAGSISIEWSLAHPSCRALAIESEPARCERIRANALNLGILTLDVIETRAPEGLSNLPRPQAVFIGGGARDERVFEACWQALAPGGRLVINSVSLESEQILLSLYAKYGGTLKRIAIETAAPLGGVTSFRPALAVVQWRVVKP
jgi:precorrin-6Y C5,15-methyltransferase (decarboxylating)